MFYKVAAVSIKLSLSVQSQGAISLDVTLCIMSTDVMHDFFIVTFRF